MTKISMLAFLFGIGCLAQAQPKISFETTGAYSFNLDTPGLNFRSYYFLNERFHLGVEYTHLFTHDNFTHNELQQTSADVFDLNANYFFKLNKHLLIYSVTGIDFTTEKEVSITEESRHLNRENAIGYNLGAGIEVPINHHLALITEFTHTFSDLRDNLLFVGMVYELSFSKHPKKIPN